MRINGKIVKDHRYTRSLRRFANSNFVAKIIVAFVIWLFALIPIWLYIISRILITPEGFWQEFAIFMVFALGIGWLQAFLIFFGGILTVSVIIDDM